MTHEAVANSEFNFGPNYVPIYLNILVNMATNIYGHLQKLETCMVDELGWKL